MIAKTAAGSAATGQDTGQSSGSDGSSNSLECGGLAPLWPALI
jgi:hypothetical protein